MPLVPTASFPIDHVNTSMRKGNPFRRRGPATLLPTLRARAKTTAKLPVPMAVISPVKRIGEQVEKAISRLEMDKWTLNPKPTESHPLVRSRL